MPNSSWTETGASIYLVPVTTPVQDAAQESPDYLTNSDKIALMAQYSAELSTKTQLDSAAASLSVSSAAYDNAVAAISTGLITAGAPANWATAWPDGTTSGPWTGIQNSLGNWWSQVATQRAALQTSISSQQSANAQVAATAAAATDATNKMNTAVSIAAPIVVSGLPALPSTTYPNGKVVWNSADNKLYKSTGSAWTLLSVDAANLVAESITAGQIAAGAVSAAQIAAGAITTAALTVANFDNLIPNPNSEQSAPAGGWPPGAYEAVGLSTDGPYAGTYCRRAQPSTLNQEQIWEIAEMPASEGEQYYFEAMCKCDGGVLGEIRLAAYDATGTYLGEGGGNNSTASSTYAKLSLTFTVPANAVKIKAFIGATSTQYVINAAKLDNFYLRRMADANLLVDGSITTAKINAGGISADVIKTGTLDASVVTVSNLNASNITTGTLSASKVLFPDGSALTTASRVLTSMTSIPANRQTDVGGASSPYPWIAISGTDFSMGFSVIAESASDQFLINGNLVMYLSGSIIYGFNIALCVDGNTTTPAAQMAVSFRTADTSAVQLPAPFGFTLNGLSAGSHSLQFYIQQTQAESNCAVEAGSFATCIRIF